MSTAFIKSEINAAQNAYVQQACTLAGITLLLFETCQTADLELEYIWACGRAHMILLVVALRHVQLVSLILSAIVFAFPSPESCTTFSLIASLMDVIPYVSWAVFLTWRAYALSSGNKLVALLVFIGSASFAAPSLLLAIGITRSYHPTIPSICNTQWDWAEGMTIITHLVDVSRPVNIFAEAIVLVLTCRTTYLAWRSSKRARRPTSLSDVLYENGILCFSIGTVLQLVTYILSVLPSTSDQAFDTMTIFRDVLITISLSRFILELAKVGAQVSDADQGVPATRGVLTTEWTGEITDVPSQWTLDDEYDGRGFDRDIESFELKERNEA